MARAGVEIAPDTKTLAAEVATIITSLPKPAALDATVAAIVDAGVRPRVIIEASTFTIEDKLKAERALRKAGHVMLDCPVSGTGSQAQVKDLVIYASGDTATIRRLRPLFAGFSRAMHDLGAFGNGSRMKYVANLLVAINNVASAEAMVLGLKAGLDPQTVFEMVKTGAGNSRVFELRAPMMVKNRYDDATMKISVWQKDMAVIGEFAKTIGVPTPMFDASVPIYQQAMKSRPRRARHRRGLRGAGKDGRGEAREEGPRQDAQIVAGYRGSWTVRTTLAVGLPSTVWPVRVFTIAASYCGSDITGFFALRCTILKPLALSCCSSVGSASAVECWKSCIRTMPLPRFSSLVITDVITLSGFLSLKSKESTSIEKMPMFLSAR